MVNKNKQVVPIEGYQMGVTYRVVEKPNKKFGVESAIWTAGTFDNKEDAKKVCEMVNNDK